VAGLGGNGPGEKGAKWTRKGGAGEFGVDKNKHINPPESMQRGAKELASVIPTIPKLSVFLSAVPIWQSIPKMKSSKICEKLNF
jgi:hypothetical protein